MTIRSIVAVVFFIMVYLALLILSLGITIISTFLGLYIIMAHPSIVTIALGLGLSSLGFIVLIFLFKFLFKKHKIDKSHLLEISERKEPKLYAFIREIVGEVKTDFPKRVYLSGDVNAGVFYDSNFWSMLLPVRKNLQIGMGLVNITTEVEFKAILAHEFGHFSQRSMKLGSYVYQVNQVIYNMLYENDSYDRLVNKWASISGYISFFVAIATRIIRIIQWILRRMYDLVNLSYMALSREMEFHADDIAAHVTGYVPFKEALLRLDFGEHAFQSVLTHYDLKVDKKIASKNLFRDQLFVMNFLASKSKLPLVNGFPLVSASEANKYNKSKLTISDQWASHPSNEERIKALESKHITREIGSGKPANELFKNAEKLQEKITSKIFAAVPYQGKVKYETPEAFMTEYADIYNSNRFSDAYNGYYDDKSPFYFDIDALKTPRSIESFDKLFGSERVEMVYEYIGLLQDRSLLENIQNHVIRVKSFDYDGQKFSPKKAVKLLKTIQEKELKLKNKILNNDVKIYQFFYAKAKENNSESILKENYKNFFAQDSEFDQKLALFNQISAALEFTSVTTPTLVIMENFMGITNLESELKNEIRKLMDDELLEGEILNHTKDNFKKYLSENWIYFTGEQYNNELLEKFFAALNDYRFLISRKYFLTKLALLNYQIGLIEA